MNNSGRKHDGLFFAQAIGGNNFGPRIPLTLYARTVLFLQGNGSQVPLISKTQSTHAATAPNDKGTLSIQKTKTQRNKPQTHR